MFIRKNPKRKKLLNPKARNKKKNEEKKIDILNKMN